MDAPHLPMTDRRTRIGLTMHDERTAAVPAIADALPWRTWPAGQDEARSRQVPLLVVAEAPWTNGAQRLAYVLGRDERLRAACQNRMVPVLADPHDPGLPIDRWHWSAIQVAGTLGPPLILVLTEAGLPFLAYPSMQVEGDDLLPSLASVVAAAADHYAVDPDAVAAEAGALANGFAVGQGDLSLTGAGLWESLAPALDNAHGGLDELPRHPHPQLLWYALDLVEDRPEIADVRPWLERTLVAMLQGGIRDQLGGGFHFCARDARWIAPHFEKPVALNAQLAAVYARAAVAFQQPGFHTEGAALADFCQVALRQRVDAIGSDTPYYTWTSIEMLQAVDRACVQPLGLHYHIVPGASRQALHQAVPKGGLGKFTHTPVADTIGLLERGQRQMLAARQRRPQPELVRLGGPARQAVTIQWLARAAAWNVPVDATLLGDTLDRISTDAPATLEDGAAILLALLAAHERTGEDRWRERAATLGATIRERFVTDGGVSNLPAGAGFGSDDVSWAVVDTDIPAAVASLVEGFATLGALLSDPTFTYDAVRISHLYAAPVIASGPWAAAYWNASRSLGATTA